MISRNFVLIILSFFPLFAFGQQESGLHFMKDVWQTSCTNPATMPDQRYLIGLGSVGFQLYQPDIRIANYINKNADGSRYLDVDGILKDMPDETHLEGGFYLETLRLGMKKGKWQLGIHHAFINRSAVTYPKDLVGLAWQGNGPYIGDTLFLGPTFDVTSYNEIALEGAYSMPHLTIGAGIKVLSGIYQITTEKTLFSLYTSDDIYQLDVNTDYLAHTSGLVNYEGFSDTSFIPGIKTNTKLRFTENLGMAFDLGFKYSPVEKLDITASILGLGGAIKWKKDAKSLYSKGHFYYEGEDIQLLLENNSISIDSRLDTIKEIFDFKENTITYSTSLPINSYISALYRFSDKWQAGALGYIESYKGITKTAFSINGNYKPTQWLSVGTALSYRNESFRHLGINFVLKIGSVQIYAVTDDVITVFEPTRNHFASGRAGINLIFSANKAVE